jgi:SAM-dependent methyltransferase
MKKYKGKSTLEVLEGADNYNQWIAQTMQAKLVSPALEIGAGTGNITQYFKKVKSLTVTDIDPELVAGLKKRFAKSNNFSFAELDIENQVSKKMIGHYATVFGVNVLEHIKDDTKALKNIHKILKKDGKLILLIPAMQFAYTRLDKELGHFRRYEKESLIKKLKSTGYHVDEIFYFNIVGLLSWVVRDKVEKKNIYLKPYQIAIFDMIVPLVKRIESIIKPPLGISLIVYATKK